MIAAEAWQRVDLFTATFARVQLKRFHLAASKIFFMQTQIHMHAFLLSCPPGVTLFYMH